MSEKVYVVFTAMSVESTFYPHVNAIFRTREAAEKRKLELEKSQRWASITEYELL